MEDEPLATVEPSLPAASGGLLLPIRPTTVASHCSGKSFRDLYLSHRQVKIIPLTLGNLNGKLAYMSIMGVKPKAF